jgi:putative Holliday junction resolvase
LTRFAPPSYTPRTVYSDTDLSNSKSINTSDERAPETSKRGRLLALDLGQKRVGVAVTDELRITVRPLPPIRRTSWKQLVRDVAALVSDFDAQSMVIGLPLSLDGTESSAAQEARRQARNFELSLHIPVFLQDERLTSIEVETDLRAEGFDHDEILERVDSAAAALILRDYLASAPKI